MTASALTLVPGGRATPGAGAGAEPVDPFTDATLAPAVAARVARRDYPAWFARLERCGFCTRPVRLRGYTQRTDSDGQAEVFSSADLPDGTLLVRCGNRRAAACPGCAREYAGDMWQLVFAGLAGGRKGVPTGVAAHPAVFVTLTAPGFGAVHTTPTDAGGRPAACRPRARKTLCRHGRPTWCRRTHCEDDPRLGEPLCGDCYDYPGAVLFNWTAPELWRRFTIAVRRHLAHQLGLTHRQFAGLARVAFVKVAEFQRRGVIHFHAIIRIDAPGDGYLPPRVSVPFAALVEAVRLAAAQARTVTLTGQPHRPALELRFGPQVKTLPVRDRAVLDAELQPGTVASYVAKYVTKAAEDFGLSPWRIAPDQIDQQDLRPHIAAMLRAATRLARAVDECAGLDRWLHMLGFRGHWGTKSRTFSTTLGTLRAERRTWRRQRDRPELVDQLVDQDDAEQDTTLVIKHWRYLGAGYNTPADAALAALAASQAREYAEAIHEEISHLERQDQRRQAA